MFRCEQQCISTFLTNQKNRPFGLFGLQEIILSSGVFRRETASGFYPWGKVDSPRKRVAEGLGGWRHGNSFPMTQSAQSHRQMRSIPLCSKAVFLCFCFLFPSMCIIYPQYLSTEPIKRGDCGRKRRKALQGSENVSLFHTSISEKRKIIIKMKKNVNLIVIIIFFS